MIVRQSEKEDMERIQALSKRVIGGGYTIVIEEDDEITGYIHATLNHDTKIARVEHYVVKKDEDRMLLLKRLAMDLEKMKMGVVDGTYDTVDDQC